MGKNNKTLLLFTGEFPYGKKGEPFLEDEIGYLAKHFSHVYVFPRIKTKKVRFLPKNVTVQNDLIYPSFVLRKQAFLLILSAIFAVLKETWQTKGGYRYFFHLKHFLYTWIDAKKGATQLKQWMDINLQKNILCYTYWSDTALLALSLLKKQNRQLIIITRTHRFDLYDDRNIGMHVPYRLTKYKAVDAIYCISRHGKRYLENKLPNKYHHKLNLAYLGVNPPKVLSKKRKSELPIIVSCARMETFKRISMIPKVLKNITTPAHWVHFGDGTEFNLVKQEIKGLPAQIKVTLMGQLTNREIHEFYQDNEIALFLSLSSSEGLPVSMMEAISYGIPIIATGVNGVPEIVNFKTGVLLEMDESVQSIAKKIDVVLKDKPFDSQQIIDFYQKTYNAQRNYANFAKDIADLL